jgi:hypothetical protein
MTCDLVRRMMATSRPTASSRSAWCCLVRSRPCRSRGSRALPIHRSRSRQRMRQVRFLASRRQARVPVPVRDRETVALLRAATDSVGRPLRRRCNTPAPCELLVRGTSRASVHPWMPRRRDVHGRSKASDDQPPRQGIGERYPHSGPVTHATSHAIDAERASASAGPNSSPTTTRFP